MIANRLRCTAASLRSSGRLITYTFLSTEPFSHMELWKYEAENNGEEANTKASQLRRIFDVKGERYQ